MSNTTTLLPIRIVRHKVEVNLNTVSHNQRVLIKNVRDYERASGKKLKHCEALCYSNVGYDKFRLVVMFFNIPVLILPPVEPEDRLSMYLKISMFLKRFSTSSEITKYLEQEIEEADDRIIASRKRIANAKKAVKKRKAA